MQPEADAVQTPSRAPIVALALLWPLAIAYAGYRWAEQRVGSLEQGHTPVAVVDVTAFVKASQEGESADERVANGLRRARKVADDLRAAGYLVLDKKSAYAVPDAILVSP